MVPLYFTFNKRFLRTTMSTLTLSMAGRGWSFNAIWLTLSSGGSELKIQGWGKNACTTYFGHISSMEALIFIKFEIYDHKIVLDHQPKRVNLRCLTKIQIRVNKNEENAVFGHCWIDTKKSYFIHFCQSGQNIMSLLKRNIQIPPPLSTDWHH